MPPRHSPPTGAGAGPPPKAAAAAAGELGRGSSLLLEEVEVDERVDPLRQPPAPQRPRRGGDARRGGGVRPIARRTACRHAAERSPRYSRDSREHGGPPQETVGPQPPGRRAACAQRGGEQCQRLGLAFCCRCRSPKQALRLRRDRVQRAVAKVRRSSARPRAARVCEEGKEAGTEAVHVGGGAPAVASLHLRESPARPPATLAGCLVCVSVLQKRCVSVCQ